MMLSTKEILPNCLQNIPELSKWQPTDDYATKDMFIDHRGYYA